MRKNREYELQFEIENACTLDCIHCSSFAMRHSGKRLYTDEKMVEFIACFQGPVHVYLTGGDPVLYPNLISLCQSISSCKEDVSVGLYTTGNYSYRQPIPQSLATHLSHSGVTDCYFSIYNSMSEAHDMVTGCPGSFKNTLASVDACLAAGIQPKAHLVLCRQNYEMIEDIIAFCRDKGFIEVRILKLTPAGNAENHWDKIGIPMERQRERIVSLIQRKDQFNITLSFSGYPSLYPCRASKSAVQCQAGTNLLYVTLSGDVYPCACAVRFGDRYKLGNVADVCEVRTNLNVQYPNECNRDCLGELC